MEATKWGRNMRGFLELRVLVAWGCEGELLKEKRWDFEWNADRWVVRRLRLLQEVRDKAVVLVV
jgi:hypothetical protein